MGLLGLRETFGVQMLSQGSVFAKVKAPNTAWEQQAGTSG